MNPSAFLAASGSTRKSWPAIRTVPAVGCRMPAIMRMVVVLPAPFGPRKPKSSPAGTTRSRERTAVNDP